MPSHLLSADLKARLKDRLDVDCTDWGVSDASRIRVIAGRPQLDPNGQMLAALTGWSQATFVSELEIQGDSAVVTREVDGGLQKIKVSMPTIVTVDLRLNEPRYASLPNIMKAKKKPMDEKTAADIGVDVSPRLNIVSTSEPEARAAGIKVGSVDELVERLKEVGAV